MRRLGGRMCPCNHGGSNAATYSLAAQQARQNLTEVHQQEGKGIFITWNAVSKSPCAITLCCHAAKSSLCCVLASCPPMRHMCTKKQNPKYIASSTTEDLDFQFSIRKPSPKYAETEATWEAQGHSFIHQVARCTSAAKCLQLKLDKCFSLKHRASFKKQKLLQI